MSALPPKADMCSATRDVRFVPIADMCSAWHVRLANSGHRALFDHLVGACEQRGGTVRPSALAVFRLMTSSYLVALVGGLSRHIDPQACRLKKRPRLSGRTLANCHEAHRCTSTGILECVSTLTVSLPRTTAEMPWRPCEAMTTRSQPFDFAVSMIAGRDAHARHRLYRMRRPLLVLRRRRRQEFYRHALSCVLYCAGVSSIICVSVVSV